MVTPHYHPFLLLLWFCSLTVVALSSSSLTPGYYLKTCPPAERIVREVIHQNMLRDQRSAASVMRLQFHDCFVNGCDASLLLDDTPTMLGEKNALANVNSLRCYHVIDEAKEELEKACPGVVSCADVIIMAARDAVALTGGPYWEVLLGRKDSLTANQDDANLIMPSPRAKATSLVSLFHSLNLSTIDLVALSGSHTIGYGRCFSVVFRLYNQSGTGRSDPNMEEGYREMLDGVCPVSGDGNVTCGLDSTPLVFDNKYFKDLVGQKGFLNSDQTLFSDDDGTMEVVRRFAQDEEEFFLAFTDGMVRMGNLQKPGRIGEVRRNCRVVNERKVTANICSHVSRDRHVKA